MVNNMRKLRYNPAKVNVKKYLIEYLDAPHYKSEDEQSKLIYYIRAFTYPIKSNYIDPSAKSNILTRIGKYHNNKLLENIM